MSEQVTVKQSGPPGTITYKGQVLPVVLFSKDTQLLFALSARWSELITELTNQEMDIQAQRKALEIAVFTANAKLRDEAESVLAKGVLE